MTIRIFDDETGEELDPSQIEFEDNDGNVAVMEGEEQEEALEDMVLPVIVEAILDGRLPSTDEEFQEVAQLGLSLGVVVNTAKGWALAKDCVDENGLELGYAANFDKIRGFGTSLHAATAGRTFKRVVAKAKGRASSAIRGAANAVNSTTARDKLMIGGSIAGGALVGRTVGRAANRAVFGGGKSNALVANAEARNKK